MSRLRLCILQLNSDLFTLYRLGKYYYNTLEDIIYGFMQVALLIIMFMSEHNSKREIK